MTELEEEKDEVLQQIRNAGTLTESDLRDLRRLLKDKTFQRLLCTQLLLSDSLIIQLGNSDLTTEAGVKSAVGVQARAKAIANFIIELVDEAFNPNLRKEKSNA